MKQLQTTKSMIGAQKNKVKRRKITYSYFFCIFKPKCKCVIPNFYPIIGHIIKDEKFLNEVREFFIFYHVTYKLVKY